MRTAVKQGVSNCSYVLLTQTGKGPRKPNIMAEKLNKIKPFMLGNRSYALFIRLLT